MNYPILVFIVMLFLFSFPCAAQEAAQKNRNSLFSLDISYAITGLLNHGGGVGLIYEKKLFDFLSVTGNFGHMTFLTDIKDVYNTSVHLSVFGNYYPLSNGLDKLYVSVGNGCDFMNYFGSGELPNTSGDILIHITPQLGWKLSVRNYLMFDISTAYKFIILDSQNYAKIKDYVNPGFRFVVGVKIHFSEILKGTS